MVSCGVSLKVNEHIIFSPSFEVRKHCRAHTGQVGASGCQSSVKLVLNNTCEILATDNDGLIFHSDWSCPIQRPLHKQIEAPTKRQGNGQAGGHTGSEERGELLAHTVTG